MDIDVSGILRRIPDEKEIESSGDKVNHPSHYTQGKVECIDAIESATVHKNGLDAVCTANIIKYIWRCEHKNGLEDLKKARWYLEKMIQHNEQKGT
jgi:hypothetical protein